MSHSFYSAKIEEQKRREETYAYQIPILDELMLEEVKKANYDETNIVILQEKIENLIKKDLLLTNLLMEHISNNVEQYNPSEALISNKNSLIFQGALEMSQKHFAALTLRAMHEIYVMNPISHLVIRGYQGDNFYSELLSNISYSCTANFRSY